MRHKIPAMVQQLEKSAIQATTHNERLALQLQAIELQISMVISLWKVCLDANVFF